MIDIDVLTQLIPNPRTMLVTLLSTLILFLLCRRFLWKSVQGYFGKRADKMQADLDESEKNRQAALADRQKALSELQAASGRADDIVNAAVKEASSQKESILQQARKEADNERARAHEQIEAERRAMYAGLQKEMVNVVMDAAGKLIGQQNPEELDRRAVDAFVKEASGNDQ